MATLPSSVENIATELTFTILYYEGQGLGELPRMLIRAAGFPLKNLFVDDNTMITYKPKLLFGQVPRLTVENKKGEQLFELYQSRAIIHYLATLGKFNGSTPEEAAVIEQYFEGLRETTEEIYRAWFGGNRNESMAAFQSKGKLQETLKRYDNFLSNNKTGSHLLVGERVTYVDFFLFQFLEDVEILNDFFKEDSLRSHENLRLFRTKMQTLPSIKDNLADPARLKSFFAMPEVQ